MRALPAELLCDRIPEDGEAETGGDGGVLVHACRRLCRPPHRSQHQPGLQVGLSLVFKKLKLDFLTRLLLLHESSSKM